MLKSKVRENTSAVADLLNYLFLCSVLLNDRSCNRISQALAGNMRESHWILQRNTRNTWNVGAVFPSIIFWIFSDDFRTDPTESLGSCWNSPRKNPENSQPEYCFQLASIFRCIPAVSSRTSFTWLTKVRIS